MATLPADPKMVAASIARGIAKANLASQANRHHQKNTIQNIKPLTGDLSPFKTCQWLHGEAWERNFCDQPTISGRDWCKEHLNVVYATQTTSRLPQTNYQINNQPVRPVKVDGT